MPIQFNCPACSQPIEVDDLVAGKSARCPYCSKVVQAPGQSTLNQAAAARPVAPPRPAYPPPPVPGSSAEGLHVGAPPPMLLLSQRWARPAIFCTLLVVVLMGVVGVQLVMASTRVIEKEYAGRDLPTTLTAEEKERMRQALGDELEGMPWVALVGFLAELLAIVGLACGARSLSYWRPGNWRGYTSVAVCGLLLLCTGASLIFGLLGGGV